MTTRRRGGYVIRQYLTDAHPPMHVHVYKDGKLVCRIAIPSGEFLTKDIPSHCARALKACRAEGLVE